MAPIFGCISSPPRLLVMHPYDVGDRIQLGEGDTLRIYTIQKSLGRSLGFSGLWVLGSYRVL